MKAQWAAEVGASYDVQNGSFVAPCGCTFANGSGVGFTGGVSYDIIKDDPFIIGVKPNVEFQRFTSHEVTPELQKIANGDNEQITFTYAGIEPYVRYNIQKTGLFVQAAPGFQYLLAGSFHHSVGAEPDEEEAGVNPDTAIDVRSMRYYARASVGYVLDLSNLVIEPTLSVGLPLNDLTIQNASDWRVMAYYLTVGIRF